ncbi:C4-dicarboxylate transport protein [Streptomyces alboniger]
MTSTADPQKPPRSVGPQPSPLHRRYGAVPLGIAVGFIWPDFAKELKPIGTGFVNLIKMMISPIIFCTIVLGVGSVRKAAKVGKVGGLALAYFIAMSAVALAIGLIVGNILHPGSGMEITESEKGVGHTAADEAEKGLVDFALGIIPKTLVSAFTEGEVLQNASSWRCSWASPCRPWGAPASPSCAASSTSRSWSSACSA